MNKNYWNQRYLNKEIGWDLGDVSQPIKGYVDQLSNRDTRILIPGCGHAYEAEYLWRKGFKNTYVLDVSDVALKKFKKKCSDFPEENLINMDFFEHESQYDLILEQTFFCALLPELREKYVQKMADLLNKKGKLVGLLFNVHFEGGPPFGGSKEEYLKLFQKHFDLHMMEEAHNSVKPRAGRELFFIAKVKPRK